MALLIISIINYCESDFMKLIILIIWFFTVSVIPLSATTICFFFLRNHLKLLSGIGVLFSIGLIVRDLLFYMPQQSFFERLVAYFAASHLCVSFYAIYFPIGILFILYPLIFTVSEHLINKIK